MSDGERTLPGSLRHDLPLWAGLLAAPIAWAVQLETVYALATPDCAGSGPAALHATSIVCFFAALAGTAVALRGWGAARGRTRSGDAMQLRSEFMGMLGAMGSAFFTVVIVALWIAVFMLDPCPVS